MNYTKIIHNLHFLVEANMQKLMYFYTPNYVATAAMQTSDR